MPFFVKNRRSAKTAQFKAIHVIHRSFAIIPPLIPRLLAEAPTRIYTLFMWKIRRKKGEAGDLPGRIQDKQVAHMGRRLFLKAAGLCAMAALVPRQVWSFFVESLQVRTVERDDFKFDPATGTIRWDKPKRTEPYALRVEGSVQHPMRLSYKDIRAFPSVTQISDFHCVEGWSVKDIEWRGFRFGEIVKRAKPDPEARYAVFHSLGRTSTPAGQMDHYVESLPLTDLLNPEKACLLALEMNGKPLSHDHGAPLRLISPYDLAYKGAKYVTRIEFSRTAQPGWWTLANPIYPINAPVPKDRLRNRQPKKSR